MRGHDHYDGDDDGGDQCGYHRQDPSRPPGRAGRPVALRPSFPGPTASHRGNSDPERSRLAEHSGIAIAFTIGTSASRVVVVVTDGIGISGRLCP